MIATETSTIVLVAAVVTLCISTAVMALGLPSTLFRWRRPARPVESFVPENGSAVSTPNRRVVTGRPAVLPSHRALVRPPIELGPAPAPRLDPDEVREAIELVEMLIDDDPEQLAGLISMWLDEDQRSLRRDER